MDSEVVAHHGHVRVLAHRVSALRVRRAERQIVRAPDPAQVAQVLLARELEQPVGTPGHRQRGVQTEERIVQLLRRIVDRTRDAFRSGITRPRYPPRLGRLLLSPVVRLPLHRRKGIGQALLRSCMALPTFLLAVKPTRKDGQKWIDHAVQRIQDRTKHHEDQELKTKAHKTPHAPVRASVVSGWTVLLCPENVTRARNVELLRNLQKDTG